VSERGEAAQRPDHEADLHALLGTIRGAVYRREAKPPWHFEAVSAAIEQIAGYRAQDLVSSGAMAEALVPDSADLPSVTDAIRAAVSTWQGFELEYRIRHADGTTRWIEDRGLPGHDGSGTVTWIDGVIFDVTERKQAEHVLTRSGTFAQRC
jgi:PAS domain S-box-containing protein